MFTRNVLCAACVLMTGANSFGLADEIQIFGYDLDGKDARTSDSPFEIVVRAFDYPTDFETELAPRDRALQLVDEETPIEISNVMSVTKKTIKSGETILFENVKGPIILVFARSSDEDNPTALSQVVVENNPGANRQHILHVTIPKADNIPKKKCQKYIQPTIYSPVYYHCRPRCYKYTTTRVIYTYPSRCR